MKKQGWQGESQRHAMSSRGISTTTDYNLDREIWKYKGGYKRLKLLKQKLQKVNFHVVDFRLTTGWAIGILFFVDQVEIAKNRDYANNVVYPELKRVGIPTSHNEWSYGDGHSVIIQVNKLEEE